MVSEERDPSTLWLGLPGTFCLGTPKTRMMVPICSQVLWGFPTVYAEGNATVEVSKCVAVLV